MWSPALQDRNAPLYQAIADALGEDLRAGRLAGGDRLPTVRALAEGLSVTVGTVHRAYALAEKRGLISRQVGRGCFVRADRAGAEGATPGPGAATTSTRSDVASGVIDLTRNEPANLRVGEVLGRTLIEMGRECDLTDMLSYGNSQGQPRHRELLASWIGRRGHRAAPEQVIVTSGAQQALTTALGALSQPGDILMVERFTYPGIKNLARIFGLTLAPLAIDEGGILPESFEAVSRDPAARLLYCMPSVHNPTTATLNRARREAIARTAAERGIIVIEDDVNPREDGAGLPAFAALYPERSVYISSLSKTVAPGLRVGIIASPPALMPDLLAATQTTNWMAPPLMAELACRWIEDGTAAQLALERDALTQDLHDLAARCLAGTAFKEARHTPQVWLPLAPVWRGEEFAQRLATRGVLVMPGERFAIETGPVPPAVRICLRADHRAALERALTLIADLAREGPGPVPFQM